MSDDLNGAIADLEKAEAEIERLRKALSSLVSKIANAKDYDAILYSHAYAEAQRLCG